MTRRNHTVTLLQTNPSQAAAPQAGAHAAGHRGHAHNSGHQQAAATLRPSIIPSAISRAASKKLLTADLQPLAQGRGRAGGAVGLQGQQGGGAVELQSGEALMKSRFVLWDGGGRP
jgi:hypothetical protein